MTRSGNRIFTAWILLIAAASAACAANPQPPPPGPDVFETYRVGPPDQLEVTIQPEPVILRTVTVRPDGMISLDLIGDIPASGRTVEEIAADVEQRILRYKRGAKATIALVQPQSKTVILLGETGNTSLPLVKQTRVAEAIAIAGGPNNLFASRGHIRVIRTAGGETVVFRVNLKAIERGDLRTNILLASGDIVYVPPTTWARVGYMINALLFPFQPFMGIAWSAAGGALVR